MNNCYIYCRVSTEEQADKGLSLDTQEKLCRDFAERNGYRVTGTYRDEGRSGTNLERPALQELLSRCTGDSATSAVIVQETDRLARNTADHLGIKSILKKAGVKLISIAQPMLDDSPEGMMIDTILASVNQFQSDINSRKTKRGVQQKFDLGWWPGWAPLGYINAALDGSDDSGRTLNVIKKDPEKWELVREGFQMYLSGNYSADEIIDILHAKGLRSKQGKKVPHSVMVRTLRNPFYAGIMRWNNQERKGRHEPMITLQEHKHVLQIMESHNVHACRRRKHKFILRGFAFCNICGHRYVGEIHRAKKKDYYHCGSMRLHSNRGQNVEVSVLEKEIEDQFQTIQFSHEFSELIISELKARRQEQRKTTSSEKQILHNRKKAIEAKRDKAEDKLLDGVILDADFARLRTKLNDQLAQIQDQMDDLEGHEELDIEAAREILRLSQNIHHAYKMAPYELKRRYLAIFWDKFLVQDKKIVEAIPTELIQALYDEQSVILMSGWRPSPPLIRTLQNRKYMKELRGLLQEVASLHEQPLTSVSSQ